MAHGLKDSDARPSTWKEMYYAHPDVSVFRDDQGKVEVADVADWRARYTGLNTVLRVSSLEGDVFGSALEIVGRPTNGSKPTRFVVPTFGEIKDIAISVEGDLPSIVYLAMAAEGVCLLDDLHKLPGSEQDIFADYPGSYHKAYDGMRVPEPDISGGSIGSVPESQLQFATLAVARHVFFGSAA